MLVALALTVNLVSCDSGMTTNTESTAFATIAAKQEFLERYVKFRRNYEDLHYRLSFIDGSGMVPGPSEWNIRILATVPADEIDQWTNGLQPVGLPELDWVTDIPNAPTDLSGFTWYQDERKTVGINLNRRVVLYRSHSS